MTRCAMAGGCSNDALGLYRIFGVGDRALCQVHVDSLDRMGMDYRRLDDAPPLEWQKRLRAKDMTPSTA